MCFFQLEVEFLFRTCLKAYCQAQPKSQQNWAELSLIFLFIHPPPHPTASRFEPQIKLQWLLANFLAKAKLSVALLVSF